jgi:hypothetical protein
MKIRENLAVSDNGFVFDPETGESFTVNLVGVDIIKQLQKNPSKEDLIERMEEEYEIDALTLEKSISDFLIMMQEFKLTEND